MARFSAWRRYQVRRDIPSLSQGFLASMVRARSSIRGRPFFRGFIGRPCFPSSCRRQAASCACIQATARLNDGLLSSQSRVSP
jgi:hypothetical protein